MRGRQRDNQKRRLVGTRVPELLDLADVRIVQRREDPCLAEEQIDELGVLSRLRVQQLDRVAQVRKIWMARPNDLAECASPELGLDDVVLFDPLTRPHLLASRFRSRERTALARVNGADLQARTWYVRFG